MDKKQLEKFFDKKQQKDVINRLNKKLQIEKATVGSDPRTKFAVLPTFSIGLNYRLGGGYRRRKMHLNYGEKSVGKSFGDYKNTGVLQRLCRNCLGVLPFDDKLSLQLRTYFVFPDCACNNPMAHRICRIDYESDYEHVSDPEDSEVYQAKKSHAEKIGVISDYLTVIFSSSIEECTDIMKEVITKLEFDYISIDSLQGAQSQYVFDKDGVDDTMGVDAKKLTRVLKDVMHAFHSVGLEHFHELPVVNIISQMRMKIGGTMSFASFSGGKALEHQMGAINKWVREKYITQDGNEVTTVAKNDVCALRVAYKNDKSKFSKPYFTGTVDMYFTDAPKLKMEHGDVNYLLEIASIGEETGTIRRGGGTYYIGDEKFTGKIALNEAMLSSPDLVAQVLGIAKAPVPEEAMTPEDILEMEEREVTNTK